MSIRLTLYLSLRNTGKIGQLIRKDPTSTDANDRFLINIDGVGGKSIKSTNFVDVSSSKDTVKSHAAASAAAQPSGSQSKNNDVHSLCSKKYKELRKEGMDAKSAMIAARASFGLDQNDTIDPSQAVGAMFGLR